MVPTPDNLPLLVGHVEGQRASIVEAILKGRTDLKTNLLELSKYWDVKIWFSVPTSKHGPKRTIKRKMENGYEQWTSIRSTEPATCHVFRDFFLSGETLCYRIKKGGRTGYPLSLDLVTRYEPILETNEWTSFEQFKAKFDPYFIDEAMITSLWNEKSGQTGERYKPSDFRTIGKVGRERVERFLGTFKGVTSTDTEGYQKNDDGRWNFSVHHYSRGNGRDITISHTLDLPRVFYSSEYPGCGNGRYGLLVNKNEYLWLEDD